MVNAGAFSGLVYALVFVDPVARDWEPPVLLLAAPYIVSWVLHALLWQLKQDAIKQIAIDKPGPRWLWNPSWSVMAVSAGSAILMLACATAVAWVRNPYL